MPRACEMLKFAPQAAVAAKVAHSVITADIGSALADLPLFAAFVPFHRIGQLFNRVKDPVLSLSDVSNLNVVPFKDSFGIPGFVFSDRVFISEGRLKTGKTRGLLEHENAHLLGASEAQAWKLGIKSVAQTPVREYGKLSISQLLSLVYYFAPTLTLNILSLVYFVRGKLGKFDQSNLYSPEVFRVKNMPGEPLTEYQESLIREIEKDPSSYDLYELGIYYMWKDQPVLSKVSLNMHNKLTGGHVHSYSALGNLLRSRGRNEEALHAFERAMSFCGPKDPWRGVLAEQVASLRGQF